MICDRSHTGQIFFCVTENVLARGCPPSPNIAIPNVGRRAFLVTSSGCFGHAKGASPRKKFSKYSIAIGRRRSEHGNESEDYSGSIADHCRLGPTIGITGSSTGGGWERFVIVR